MPWAVGGGRRCIRAEFAPTAGSSGHVGASPELSTCVYLMNKQIEREFSWYTGLSLWQKTCSVLELSTVQLFGLRPEILVKIRFSLFIFSSLPIKLQFFFFSRNAVRLLSRFSVAWNPA